MSFDAQNNIITLLLFKKDTLMKTIVLAKYEQNWSGIISILKTKPCKPVKQQSFEKKYKFERIPVELLRLVSEISAVWVY